MSVSESSMTIVVELCPECNRRRPTPDPDAPCPSCLLNLGLSQSPGGGEAESLEEDPTPTFGRRGASSSPIRIIGPLGRGGVGMVYRGRDDRLERDLAIKVLRGRCRDRPEMVRRFLDEARIIGTLQHPGIVPIYELGLCDDGSPFIAMKLVEGSTFARMLDDRRSPAEDLERALGIFLHVCRAVAYAHSKGIVHRDLKPSNIMLGPFGEVQVMDWGIAKVLGRGEADAARYLESALPMLGSADASRAGAVLGTPAYMAPEQAAGSSRHADERTDVFGLGSMLCEILTGSPAYVAETVKEIHRLATAGATGPALERLTACGAPSPLIELARECLQVDPTKRPSDASALADRVLGHFQTVGKQLRAAELARAKADARADLEYSRRRIVAALVVAVTALATTLGVAAFITASRRQDARDRAAEALSRVVILRDWAREESGDPDRWQGAYAAVQQATDLLDRDAVEPTRSQLKSLQAEIAAAWDSSLADRELVGRLEQIRCHEGQVDLADIDAAYRDAFHRAGFDPEHHADLVGQEMAKHPRATAAAVAGAFDDWATVRRKLRATKALRTDGLTEFWPQLLSASQIAAPDPWINRIRAALLDDDEEALVALTRSSQLETKPAEGLVLLAHVAPRRRDESEEIAHRRGREILEVGRRGHPDDFWINIALAAEWLSPHTPPSDLRNALPFAQAAVALRPNYGPARTLLASAFKYADNLDAAAAEIQVALKLRPNDFHTIYIHGENLLDLHRPEEAEAVYKEYLPYLSAHPHPHESRLRFMLALALAIRGKIDEAVATDYAALSLRSDPVVSAYLQDLLLKLGRVAEAEAINRQALADLPADKVEARAAFRARLGETIRVRAPASPEAEAEFLAALQDDPTNLTAVDGLAWVLLTQGRREAAREMLEDVTRRAGADAAVRDAASGWLNVAKLDEHPPAPETVAREQLDAALALAALRHNRGDDVSAFAFYEAAIAVQPELLRDHDRTVPFDGACAAILAASRSSSDAGPLRRKALTWLQADMDSWRWHLDRQTYECRFHVARCIARWKIAPELAEVRDYRQLPEDERGDWACLWNDVDAILNRVAAMKRLAPPTP